MIVQPSLLGGVRPPDVQGVDLRCCDTADMVASLADGCADLVIADPPWDYVQNHGASRADNHYQCLRVPAIAAHVAMAARLGPRLALWLTWPLHAEWTAAEPSEWGAPVTGGAWVKSDEGDAGHYGQGYHWAGCSEPVLIYTRGTGHLDRAEPLRNAWVAPPSEHSRKPVEWQSQWVRRWVPPGGLVVDLYAGLGSVAEAVMRAGSGRRYVGAEIDPERHTQAMSLIAQARGAL